MIQFTKEQWKKDQYKDIYRDFDGKHPELKGRRCTLWLDDKKGTVLIIESVHFEIV